MWFKYIKRKSSGLYNRRGWIGSMTIPKYVEDKSQVCINVVKILIIRLD